MEYIVGLDVGGTKCAVVLARVGQDITIIDKLRFPTETELGFAHTKNALFQSIYQILEQNQKTPQDIRAIGVSCGGPLNSKDGIILCPPNLPGWVDIPFTSMLEEEFGTPAYLQNDAKACALVEWRLGAGRGTRNMMFLTMGTGMGSGIIAEGQLVTGACDMGGEVGHLRLADAGPVGFGKAGSFEGFCSGGGIARFAQSRAVDARKRGAPFAWGQDVAQIEALDTQKLAELAKAGDQDALATFAAVGEMLGKAVAYFIDILNPEVIVIGSIFGRCESLLRPAMERVLAEECIPYSLDACRVVPAGTGEQIGDLASIMVALEGEKLSLQTTDQPAVYRWHQHVLDTYPDVKPLGGDLWRAYELLKLTFEKGGKLLCCGNGGSAADADHIVGELVKGFRLSRPVDEAWGKSSAVTAEDQAYLARFLQGSLPAIALTQHTALSTAFANDVAPDMVFAQQVYGYGEERDTLLAISTSGNSANVVRAAQVAKLKGMTVIGLTGEGVSKLSPLCDVCIRVPRTDTAAVQELHLPIYHALCSMLEAQFFGAEI